MIEPITPITPYTNYNLDDKEQTKVFYFKNDSIAVEEEIKEENSMFSLSDKSDDELENVAQSELT